MVNGKSIRQRQRTKHEMGYIIMSDVNLNKSKVYIIHYDTASSRSLAPLSAALLKLGNKEIKDYYSIQIEHKRFNPDIATERLDNPKVLAFSTYLWNFNQSIEVAKRAKRKFNKCIIVFGGRSVPITKEGASIFFDKYPFVDILVYDEGEIVFNQLLFAIKNDESFLSIKGIFYKENGNTIHTCKVQTIKDFTNIPSPYLDGTFDQLMQADSANFSGFIVETNRGCPYRCAFCSWGTVESNLTPFPMERVFAELDWISRNKINYIYLADANFGIMKRDIEIARHIAKLKHDTGYPKIVAMCWAKNSCDTILKIANIFTDAEIPIHITVSVQSFNQTTLEAIKRKNMNSKYFNFYLNKANKNNLNISTDIIIGLPLETYNSFKQGMSNVLNGLLNFYFNVVYFNL